MNQEPDYSNVLPEGMRFMNALDHYSQNSGREPSRLDLIKLRASQIHACAYCIDRHTKDARTSGETEQRLYHLSVWRKTPYCTDRALESSQAARTQQQVTISSHVRTPDLEDTSTPVGIRQCLNLLPAGTVVPSGISLLGGQLRVRAQDDRNTPGILRSAGPWSRRLR